MEIAVYTTRGQMVHISGTAGYHKPGSHVSFQRILATDALQNCLTYSRRSKLSALFQIKSLQKYSHTSDCGRGVWWCGDPCNGVTDTRPHATASP